MNTVLVMPMTGIRHLILGLFCAVMTLAGATAGAVADDMPRERLSINDGWRFRKGDPESVGGALNYDKIKAWILPTGNAFVKDPAKRAVRPEGNPGTDVPFVQPGYDDSGWRRLDLPHDWGIEGPFDQRLNGETAKLPYFGVGWYRRKLQIPASDTGRRFFLDIDGAMSYSSVWLNGKFVGGWPYGYSSYQLDLTPFIRPGAENVLAIRLDNPNYSSRWYPGGGIYRNVWLVKTSPTHVAHWGAVVTTPEVSLDRATVHIAVKVEGGPADVSTDIFEDGAEKPVAKISGADGQATIAHPNLWSCETPNLYRAVTTLTAGDKVVDRVETVFGIRSIRFDADAGFLLNGKHVRLNGVCGHADIGALGTVVNVRALQRQLEILKEMGCNALRTSHNMPAPELLDLCDRMGILVMDESFDCWMSGKRHNDYHRIFNDWHEQDIRAEVRRDRNHPSVVTYSIGNEIPDQDRPAGCAMAAELTGYVHEEDPTRPTSIGVNNPQAGFSDFVKGVDVFGYNYKPRLYGKWRQANPGKPFFASETASTLSSRGCYYFPTSKPKADFQVNSYDLFCGGWATLPDDEFKGQDSYPWVGGEFVWTGFDYLGEPTPYSGDSPRMLLFEDPTLKAQAEAEFKATKKLKVPSRSSYFGIVDLCGFKKDRFYLYQAKWRPELPIAHILPHWNWPERVGMVTPVFVYTSGNEAELFLNGKSLGRKQKKPLEYRLRWDDVVYAPGELKVVAYKDGKEWAKEAVKTTGPAAAVRLAADRATIAADGADLSFITVSITDRDGLTVPRSSNEVEFEISGPGEIVATDNGDATSLEPFQSKRVKAFNGLALAIIRGKRGEPGEMVLHARSKGLTPATVRLTGK